MAAFLNTRGNSRLAIAICARCKMKVPYSDLIEDGNIAGLWVCDDGCADTLDPWRLAPPPPDQITLEHPRPDLPLTPGPMNTSVVPLQAVINTQTGNIIAVDGRVPQPDLLAVAPPVTVQQQPKPWTANTFYDLGFEVTPGNPVGATALGASHTWAYVCMVPGRSGATPPIFPPGTGREVTDFEVVWLAVGLYLP